MNITELQANVGWDRADMSVAKLAQLAWSMKETGWEAAHPVIFETLPDGSKHILWGHRRTLARAIAQNSKALTVEEIAEEIEALCTTQEAIDTCPECGNDIPVGLEYCPLCEVSLFDEEGTRVAEPDFIKVINTSLLIENYNFIIHSAGDIDIPAEERAYVDELTSQLTLIRDGLGREDADIIGLSHALHRAAHQLGGTTAKIEQFGLSGNEVAGMLAVAQMPSDVAQLVADSKLSLTASRLIYELSDTNKRQALLGIVLRQAGATVSAIKERITKLQNFALQPANMLDSPKNQNMALIRSAFFEKATTDDPIGFWTNVANGSNITIPTNIVDLVGEVSCDKCALKGRMKALPRIDVNGSYPCQKSDAETWCPYCDTAGRVLADYTVRSKADIEFKGDYSPEFYFSTIELAQAAYAALGSPELEITEEIGSSRPIDLQRAKISAFIGLHAGLNGAAHPWATHCDKCGFRTAGSPVKSDPDAPPCLWASKRSTIVMGTLEEGKYTIPLCRQYSPTAALMDIIPETDPGKTPRAVLENIYDQLLSNLEMRGKPALTFITGVPFAASERYGDWFRNRVAEVALTDAQIVTVINWLSAEINLTHNQPAPIQLPAGRVGMFKYKAL